MVRDTGIEPVTPTVSRWCSTAELTAHVYPGRGRENGKPIRRMQPLF